MNLSIRPDNADDPRDEIYVKVVDAIPDGAKALDVCQSLAMVLSAILIEHTKDEDCCVKAANLLCSKIIEACDVVGKARHSSSETDDTWQTRH